MPEQPKLKAIGFVILFVAVAFAFGVWTGQTRERLKTFDAKSNPTPAHEELPTEKLGGVEIVPGEPGRLHLTTNVIDSLKIRVASVRRAPLSEPLLLTGSLFLDSSHLAVVHTRFPGEIVEIGQVPEKDARGEPVVADGQPVMRQVRAGDDVEKGQLIAVVWSKEIGETKSELLESLSRVKASEATLKRLKGLAEGIVPGQVVLDAEQKYQSDVIAVDRAVRTLRSWRETDDEIAEVYAESKRISEGGNPTDSKVGQTWANVEIRAPLSGTVMERNGTVGEIVSTGIDLFTIADLRRMGVLANIYEEDIHKLTGLTADQRTWKVRLKAEPESPPIHGRFEVIGNVIDPSVHTAAVVGWIENPNRRLRTNQFITATIDLPGPTDAVIVPNSAVIDEGTTATVFVASDATMTDVRIRHVNVIRRRRDMALIQRSAASLPNQPSYEALNEGEFVVTSGNLELFGFLKDRPTTIGAR